MIKVNDKLINQEHFGDNTLKIAEFDVDNCDDCFNIMWCYDSDEELFLLFCIVNFIREHREDASIELTMPYIPNARQDRCVSNRVFTLKYFATFLNQLAFDRVFVLDPHSGVSHLMINNLEELKLPFDVWGFTEPFAMLFPDAGAAKKYKDKYKLDDDSFSFIIGEKHRNEDGRIVSYELHNFRDGTHTVVIRDDICSYGGTFVEAAKALRAKGVKEIYLIVSHCENNILKGDVFEHIDRVFTTDSICTISHPKLTINKVYRGEFNV